MEELHQRLGGALAQVPGLLLEPKRFSMAVHYRLVEEKAVPDVEAVVDGLLQDYPKLRKTYAKKVFEIRPRSTGTRARRWRGSSRRWGSTTRASSLSTWVTTPPMKMPSRPWPAREWESLWQTSPARRQRVIDWRATRRWRASSSVLHTPFMNPYNLNPLAARGR